MATTTSFLPDTAPRSVLAVRVGDWIASLVVTGVLGWTAFLKFFVYTENGSKVLADALGVGRGVVTLIGLVEAAAALLILLPRTRAIGALLAAGTMSGALASHATKLGFSGNAAADMWPVAILVLAAAAVVLVVNRRELPLIGDCL